jgi:hypothetical protein
MKRSIALLSSTLVAGAVAWIVQPLMGAPSNQRHAYGEAVFGGTCAKGASALRKYCTACGNPSAQALLLLVTGTTWRATNPLSCSDQNGKVCVTYYQAAPGCNG